MKAKGHVWLVATTPVGDVAAETALWGRSWVLEAPLQTPPECAHSPWPCQAAVPSFLVSDLMSFLAVLPLTPEIALGLSPMWLALPFWPQAPVESHGAQTTAPRCPVGISEVSPWPAGLPVSSWRRLASGW
jgi:hypothetical protein